MMPPMMTFTSKGGAKVFCDIDGKKVAAFPDEPDGSAKISLLPMPEEDAREGPLSWPGEYDVDGVAIRGIGHDEGARISYTVDTGKVRTAFLSSPLHEWSDYEFELLGDIDVLCIPADDAKLAQKIIDEADPRVLIPLPTKDEATFAEILKAAGAQDKEIVGEYKLKGSLPAEGREVVILKPSS